MSSSNYPSADLESVLRTLAAYTPAPSPPPAGTTYPELNEEEEEYDPSSCNPSIHATTLQQQQPQPLPPQSQPQIQPRINVPSSSAITTWPPALRHVMKFLAPDPAAMYRIRHLIRTQHEHERVWWAGREALVVKQQGREEGRRKLNDVLWVFRLEERFFRELERIVLADIISTPELQSVDSSIRHPTMMWGLTTPSPFHLKPSSVKIMSNNCYFPTQSSVAADVTELKNYDRKVHTAYKAMVAGQKAELSRLGVPFFNTSPDLMVPASGQGREGALDEEELKKQRTKMLGMLEDLCAE